MKDGNENRWSCNRRKNSMSQGTIMTPGAPLPCFLESPQPPALYTYYAIVSLVVVILAVSLMWIPFVQLVAELNNIISKVLIYANKEFLGNTNIFGLNQLGAFFNSQQGLVLITISCLSYLIYLASADFLLFAGCYIYNLPNFKYLQNLKNMALNIIEYLLTLTGKQGFVRLDSSSHFKYPNTSYSDDKL